MQPPRRTRCRQQTREKFRAHSTLAAQKQRYGRGGDLCQAFFGVGQDRRPPSDDIDAGDAEQFQGAFQLRELDTPERLLLRGEIETTIVEAMEALPEDLRTAIMLRELEGMSYEEIAQTMSCPVGTVRSRIFRAREAIDNRLRPLLS
ncbi:MAG: sigma-70 family RNA polymerase sigma factor [Pseudolabrys sp.]